MRIDRAIKELEKMGFQVQIGGHKNDHYRVMAPASGIVFYDNNEWLNKDELKSLTENELIKGASREGE